MFLFVAYANNKFLLLAMLERVETDSLDIQRKQDVKKSISLTK